jgi:hypothetical protein
MPSFWALTDFLAGRTAREVSEFGESRMTRKTAPTWIGESKDASQLRDRGIEIALRTGSPPDTASASR